MTRSRQRPASAIERCDGSLRQTSVAATAQPSSRNQNTGLGKPVSVSVLIASVSGFCGMVLFPRDGTGRVYRNRGHSVSGGSYPTSPWGCRLLALRVVSRQRSTLVAFGAKRHQAGFYEVHGLAS